MRWFMRQWKPIAAGVAIMAAAAAGIVILKTSTSPRPLLVGTDHDSRSLISRNATPWSTCPAAATTCYRWKMQEAASPLVDDLSGTSAQLTPTAGDTPAYNLHTPIVTSTGLDRKAVWMGAALTDAFQAANATPGDQTTNDFSVSFWARWSTLGQMAEATDGFVGGKETAGAALGWSISMNTGGVLGIRISDASGSTSGVISGALTRNIWYYVTVNFDRDGTATAFINGVATGVTVNIAGRPATISNNALLTLWNIGFSINYTPALHMNDVLIANGLTTLAEHQAVYNKPFAVPTGITYAQTTHRKWSHGTEVGFGERLGVYSGSATIPQWPAMVASTLIDASTNPLGTGFPAYGATTNVLGYVNAVNSWSISAGSSVTANMAEAPDGAMTADRMTQISGGFLNRVVVGGGNVAAGERWCLSFYAKKVSGVCDRIRYLAATSLTTGSPTPTTLTTSWQRFSSCSSAADVGGAKALYTCADDGTGAVCVFAGGGTCVYDIADAQYEANNVTPPCTVTNGAVSQTCNASGYTESWSGYKAPYDQARISRAEVVSIAALAPFTHSAVSGRFLWQTGDDAAYVAEGLRPTFVLKDQGGQVDAVTKAKPLQAAEEKRTYVASWDTDVYAGITNTNPRKYASLSLNGAYGRTVLESRNYNQTTQIPSVPQNQADLNAMTFYTGCPRSTTTNLCYNGVIQSSKLYARPAQDVKVEEPSHLVTTDFTGPAYLSAQSIPRFETPSGATAANTWIWDMSDLGSGGIYDRNNGVFATQQGTPLYGQFSGLLAKGNGRSGLGSVKAGGTYVQSSANNIPSLATATTGITLSVLGSHEGVYGSGGVGWDVLDFSGGIGLRVYSPTRVYCYVGDGTNFRNGCNANYSATTSSAPVVWTCSSTRVAGTWQDPVIHVNGQLLTTIGCIGVQPTNDLAPASRFNIGDLPAAACGWGGQTNEVMLWNKALSTAEILANYKRTVQTGQYWENDANTIAHYKLNEAYYTNGIGARDISGNGYHLTVVGGSPTPQSYAASWPAGSGLAKPAISSTAADYFNTSGATWHCPNDGQTYAWIGWVRSRYAIAGGHVYMYQVGSGANPQIYGMLHSANGLWYCGMRTSAGAVFNANGATDYRDNRWHLLGCRLRWSGGTWRIARSEDGAAWIEADSGDAGSFSTCSKNIYVIANGTAQFGGLMVTRDAAPTDAEMAAYYAAYATSPLSTLTYARTNAACYVIGNHSIDGDQVRCFGAGVVPYAYQSTLTTIPGNERLGFGLPVHNAVTNIALQSEDATTTWTNNNTSDAANTAVAPDGMSTADTVTATAGAGDLRQAFAAIAAVSHTYCQWLKRNGTANVAGFVRLVTNSTGVQIAQTAFTATSAWQQFCVSGTATLNDTRIETQITTNGTSVFWWGASLTPDAAWQGVYCPTATASYTCNATTGSYVAAANMTSWTRAEGVVSAIVWPRNASGYAMDLHNGANLNGAFRLLAPTTQSLVYNDSAVTQQNVTLTNAQTSIPTGAVFVWDSDTAFYNTTRRAYGQTFQSNYAGPWPTYTTDTGANWTPAAGTNLYLGMDNAAGNRINGLFVTGSVYTTR